jgi:hypothetical protein
VQRRPEEVVALVEHTETRKPEIAKRNPRKQENVVRTEHAETKKPEIANKHFF